MSFTSSPSFTYISPGLLQTMRREMRRFLLHQYTRSARQPTADSLDSWGQQTYTFADPVAGLPCFYEIREIPVVTPEGVTTLNLPRLILAYDDPTQEGDIVSNIITGDNSVIFPGPAVIERIQLRDPNMGGGVFAECTLRLVQFIPTSPEP